MSTRRKWVIFVAVGVATAAAACGTNDSAVSSGSGSKGNPAGSGNGAASSGGGSGTPQSAGDDDTSGDDAATGVFVNDASIGLSADAFVACASETVVAKELPLDLYFMLDTSGSMSDLVAAQHSKWDSVVSAMTAFVTDPGSAGIGVGLQYFPLIAAGVPASCTASSQCGTHGPCLLNACDFNVFQTVIPCDTTADCEGCNTSGTNCKYYACNPIGYCSNDHNSVCPTGPGSSTSCGTDTNGFALGTCEMYMGSTCVEGDSCAAADYAAPAVAIAELPGVATAITTSLAAHQPNGNTPTSAALTGALDEAKAFATANPGHAVVAVLATDGIPDECTPDDIPGIAQIAATALSASPSIKTFTIGVFTANDITSGTSALNEIATSGGTQQAFIINSVSQNVEQEFAAALSAIRGASLPCQYVVPLPDSGPPDFAKVNVQFTSGAGTAATLPYVETAAKCGSSGGWYYDSDPAQGGTPTAILICSATCSTVKSDVMGTIGVVLGCGTIAK
jgi:hypothetical protein